MLYKMGIWVRSKSCTTKSRKLVQDGFIVPRADHNTQGVESCTRWAVGRCLLIVELTWYTRSARWCTMWRKVGGQQRQWWARREWMGWWYLLASDQPDLPTCHPVMAFRSSYLPSSSSLSCQRMESKWGHHSRFIWIWFRCMHVLMSEWIRSIKEAAKDQLACLEMRRSSV